MVKKSENHKKNLKNLKNSLFFKMFFLEVYFFAEKSYPLSYPILGGRDSTRALQSSLFQKYENLKKLLFWILFAKEKKIAILLVFQY